MSPLLSDSFSIHKRKNNETLFYSYNETKYKLFSFNPASIVLLFKNDKLIYNNTNKEDSNKYTIEFEKEKNYSIVFEGY